MRRHGRPQGVLWHHLHDAVRREGIEGTVGGAGLPAAVAGGLLPTTITAHDCC